MDIAGRNISRNGGEEEPLQELGRFLGSSAGAIHGGDGWMEYLIS